MAISDKTDAEILAIVEPMMVGLMAASFAMDYDAHVKDFTPRLKSMVSVDGLKKVSLANQDQLGSDGGRELLRVFRRGDSIGVCWIQRFTKTDDEFIATAILVETEDGYKLDHALIC